MDLLMMWLRVVGWIIIILLTITALWWFLNNAPEWLICTVLFLAVTGVISYDLLHPNEYD